MASFRRLIMTKTEFTEAKKGLAIDLDEKVESSRQKLLRDKETYKQKKKVYKISKKLFKQEYKAKKQFLVNDFEGNHEKETKIKEKYLSLEEIESLRKKQQLPFYLHSEEVFNMVTHIVGGGLSVIGLILGIIFSILKKPEDTVCLISMIVFGITSIVLYAVSSIYHGLNINKGKRVFQVLDHCTIYILIAGTYVPISLIGLADHTPYQYILLGIVILLAALGVVLNATMMRKMVVKVISMILYIAIGWGIIFFYPWLVQGSLGISGTWLLIGGGITYTVGSILYGIGSKRRYWHSIFHIFVIGGTVLQYLCVLLYGVIGL